MGRHVQASHRNESRLIGVGSAARAPVNLVFGTFTAMARAPGPELLVPAASIGATTDSVALADDGGMDVDTVVAPSEMAAVGARATAPVATQVQVPRLAAMPRGDGRAREAGAAVPSSMAHGTSDRGNLESPVADTDGSGADLHGDVMDVVVARTGGFSDAASGRDAPEGAGWYDVFDGIDLAPASGPVETPTTAPLRTVVSSTAARIREYFDKMPEAEAAVPVVDPE